MSICKLTGTPILPSDSDSLQLDHIPLWDVYHQLGINFGERIFARIMNGDEEEEEDSPLVNVTYNQLYIDSLKVAQVLKEKLGHPETMTYALLGATSTYTYLVTIVAGWLNHWTVSFSLSRIFFFPFWFSCQDRFFYYPVGTVSKGTLVFSKPSMPKPSSQTPKVVKLLKPYSKTFPSPSRFSMSFIPKISLSTLNYPKALSKSPQFLKKSLNKFRCTCIAVVPQVGLYLSISRKTLFFFSPLGHPKPIPQSHEHIITDIIAIRTNINYVGAPVYAPLPLYHVRAFFHPPKQTKLKKKKKTFFPFQGIGHYCFTRWPIGAGHIPTFVHTKLPLTSTSFLRHLRRLPGALCFLAPVLVEDALRESPADYQVLKTTKRIFTGGAALDRTIAQRLIEMGVPIVQVYGT